MVPYITIPGHCGLRIEAKLETAQRDSLEKYKFMLILDLKI